MLDLVVVGAGPCGLACALQAQREGLSVRVLDKGTLANSIVGYPTNMEFFSTPELLEIGGHPFSTLRYKPIREEALDYYRGVARTEGLDVRLYEAVLGIDGERGDFVVRTDKGTHAARFVVVATGFFDVPNRLGCPGDDLPHVVHYYKEPYPYVGQHVVIVGAKNSAAKAALDCYRNGAKVTLVHRGGDIGETVKYWLRPDLMNRIKEGSIDALFDTRVTRIEPGTVHVEGPDGPAAVRADWVLAMTGYRPDYDFLSGLGLTFEDDPWQTPVYDPATFESSRPGVYLAGTVCGGLKTNRWFIENGRFHARAIVAHAAHGRREDLHLAERAWKTAE